MGIAGTLMAYSGSYDRGLALLAEATELNPDYPEWWNYGIANGRWCSGKPGAWEAIRKINQPDFFWLHVWRAFLSMEDGDAVAASAALAEIERLYPGFSVAIYRDEMATWHVPEDCAERAIALMREAGLPEGNPTD
jgi:hypothetical protein